MASCCQLRDHYYSNDYSLFTPAAKNKKAFDAEYELHVESLSQTQAVSPGL